MFGGGGGLNPRKMQQMMEQMGIDLTEIDAEEVIIRTADEDLVFESADVQRMDAQGQQTYQIVGEPDARPRGDEASVNPSADIDAGGGDADTTDVPNTDVQIVAQRTGASEEKAREALLEANGDLAAAVDRLE